MSKPEIFRGPIPRETTRRLAEETFSDMVKFVVDVERKIICAGGGLHSDEESMLLEDGSSQENLWGANYYPDLSGEDRFQYHSMINVRTKDGNRRQEIQSDVVRQIVRELAIHFFESKS